MKHVDDLCWVLVTACVVLFWNGESGMDLHTALVTFLTSAR